jgi:hypothetical protein
MEHRFEIVSKIKREYRRFGNVCTQLTVPSQSSNRPKTTTLWNTFLASVNDLFEHVLQDV